MSGKIMDVKGKGKLLYVGHAYHKKTRSVDFLLEILSRDYDVFRFDFDPADMNSYRGLGDLPVRDFDVLVVFQLMPSPQRIRQFVSFRRGVFFPMFDYYRPAMDLSHSEWEEYREFLIVNFSRTVHEEVQAAGFDSKYIQFFPKPETGFSWGDSGAVFFWQRVSEINVITVWQALKNFSLRALHVHQVVDPCHHLVQIPRDGSECAHFYERLEVTTSTWYETREEMLADMRKAAIYVAPRYYEGIGMSFLEAMAMGRCVVAPDGATMTEYVEHGVTGLVYGFWKSRREGMPFSPIDLRGIDIRSIQKNAYEYMRRGYARWMDERWRILDWIAAAPRRQPWTWRIKHAVKMRVPARLWRILQRARDSVSGRRLAWRTRFSFPHAKFPLLRIRVGGARYRLRFEILGFPVFEYKFESEERE